MGTKALGLAGKVTTRHGFCPGGITERKAAEAAETMAEAGLALVTPRERRADPATDRDAACRRGIGVCRQRRHP